MRIRWWLIVVYLNLWGGIAFSQDSVGSNPVAKEINSPDNYLLRSNCIFGIGATTALAALFSSINSTVAAVIIGGGLGALSRYTVSQGVGHMVEGSFHGTMTVNIIGSFVFGTVTGLIARHDGIADTAWKDLMTTGFLGGFTTFSTFAHDTVQMAHDHGILFSALYTGFSVAVAVVAILSGEYVGNTLLP